MKPLCRVSVLVSFAVFLCFLPSAFGQRTGNLKVTGSGHTVRNFEPSNFLAFALTSGEDFFKDKKDKKCDASNGGWDNNCPKAVPEGGNSLMYLLVAGLCCLGGMVLRSRRQVSMRRN